MSPLHTPRLDERILTLEYCFDLGLMKRVWQKYVKIGLRGQDLLDLHDFYDFHRNRNQLFRILKKQIVEGQYKPRPSLVIRTEKKYGVCRHLQIPAPEDAVVLQTLVENLSEVIKNAQPTTRAFYSRSHRAPMSEQDIDETFPYAWWELWPDFQTRIYDFSSIFDYVVVTDIANYYDNISFKQLRNILTSYGRIDEGLLDFLFYMLESFVWRPDYLPLTGIGLPQINFDAPRLLGHALLFEIDRYLNDRTDGNFVRWMDDIDFGISDTDKAKEILRGLDELLLTRGLRLNMGKTKILDRQQAKEYFLPDENRYLTIMTKRVTRLIRYGLPIDAEKRRIRRKFRNFLRKPNVGRWEKVYNRYFSISCYTKDRFLERYIPDLLKNNPGLRASIFRYYTNLDPSNTRFNHLKDFFLSKHCSDDTTIFSTAKVLIDWCVLAGSQLRKQIVDLAKQTAHCSHTNLATSIWLTAKYGSDRELASLIGRHTEIWKYSNFLSRQVAAVIPRLRRLAGQYRYIEKTLNETGQLDALRVLYHLNDLRKQPLSSQDKLYLLHGTAEIKIYPLGKFLIAVDLLTSDSLSQVYRRTLRTELLQRIPDPLYKKELGKITI